ncbi:MAG: hypothetical protein IPM57_09020 [Oligoflexia bacterium]|nr:hypothetical protein [Oligoflexia bacterium]
MIKLFLTVVAFGFAQNVDDTLGRKVESCRKVKSNKIVWVFKQWHLLPSDNTKEFPDKVYPQRENLTSIYKQLNKWVSEEVVKTVFAEGCTGEMTLLFDTKFNGWSMSDLQAKSESENYQKIIGHVPMMIEAKYGDKVKTVCGDDEGLIKDQNLLFSDLRAAIGFLTRLEKFEKYPEKQKPYLEAIQKAYGLNRKLKGESARDFLKSEIKKLISKIEKGIVQRNKSFMKAVLNTSFDNAVMVIGGIHAKDIKNQLQKNKINCTVVEFKGYDYEEEELLRKIHTYFK